MTTAQFFLSCWTWQPAVVVSGLVTLVVFGVLFRFSLTRRVWCLVAAVFVLLLALVSPIETLSDGYLFSAHMLQHLLLQLIVPPLLLLSLRPRPMPGQLSRGAGRWLGRLLGTPLITWGLGVGAMWIWHERSLCDAAATSTTVHAVQVVSLMVLGGVFWWPIIGPWPEQHIPPLLGVVYLFTACVGCTILGIVLTFAPVGVCPVYMHPADPLEILPLIRGGWGFTPATDQQVGGLLMWVPACMVYLSGVMGMLARYYRGQATPLLHQESLGPPHPQSAPQGKPTRPGIE